MSDFIIDTVNKGVYSNFNLNLFQMDPSNDITNIYIYIYTRILLASLTKL